LLTTNWGRLPPEVEKASALDLEVRWAEKAGVKRVVTTEDAVLGLGSRDVSLPYHVCLSDLLFGEELYKTRRIVLELPPIERSKFSKRVEEQKPGPVIGLGPAVVGAPVPGPAPHAPANVTALPVNAPGAPAAASTAITVPVGVAAGAPVVSAGTPVAPGSAVAAPGAAVAATPVVAAQVAPKAGAPAPAPAAPAAPSNPAPAGSPSAAPSPAK
jgi:hypothetical protein